jgi:hypothetical protein
MGCCGQQRAALVHGNVGGSQELSESALARSGSNVQIELTRRRAIVVRGPITGRAYRFHEGAYIQSVDPADSATLIMAGYFQIGRAHV